MKVGRNKLDSLKRNPNNPFVGLHPFDFTDADRFKGRDEVIQQALDKLTRKAQKTQPFLLLLGKSGSGKSSLLKAGILPALNRLEFSPDVAKFHTVCIEPVDLSLDPITGLIDALIRLTDIELVADQERSSAIQLVKEQPQQFVELMKERIDALPSTERVAIGVRQLEKLFMSENVTFATQSLFVDMLADFIRQCGVFVIASLRNDFYQNLSDFPELLWLKQNGGQLDVLPPNADQLKEMVTLPGTGEVLTFEEGKDGQPGLDDYLVHRALEFPNSLPLLQFILQQLFANKSVNGLLNYSTYRNLGGLERVIAKTTEAAYEALDRSEKRHFSRIINRLVKKSDKGLYERIWISMEDLGKSDRAKTLIKVFVSAGIFVQANDSRGIAHVALVHDCLFEHWPRMLESLEGQQRIQTIKDSLEQQATQWKSATRPSAFLLRPGKALDEGMLILKQGGSLSPKLRALIKASTKRVQVQKRMWVAGVSVVVALFVFTATNAYQSRVVQKQAQQKLVESHDLIEFLIADESEQLDSIGRLDLMQNGSSRSLEYLTTVEPKDDSTAAKLSRSKTFYQIGRVFLENDQFDDALLAFEKTLELDNELVEIHPSGFDYVMELAQAQYWIAMTYLKAGDQDKATQHFLLYQKTAFELVELQPDSTAAKLELSRAFYHLAKISAQRGQIESATQLFYDSVKFAEKGKSSATIEGLLAASESYQWLGDRYANDLKVSESIDALKGEKRIREILVKRDDNEDNQFSLASVKWQLANKHILIGQHKQANLVLNDLLLAAEKYSMGSENIQWQYLLAFSYSRLAQVAILSASLDAASSYFQKSYAELDENQQIANEHWREAAYERQYWYARMHHQRENSSAFDAAGLLLENADEPSVQKWQLRLANLRKASFDSDTIQFQSPSDPAELLAFIEYCTIQSRTADLQVLSDAVPQEMWAHADLEKLRSTIRQQLRELEEESSNSI
ncbi:MAG: hypothetical protein Alis3KO_29870 [Aliiglaciecola sp.]